jgi:hypothetical protein
VGGSRVSNLSVDAFGNLAVADPSSEAQSSDDFFAWKTALAQVATPAADQEPASSSGSEHAQSPTLENQGGLLDRGLGVLRAGTGVVEVVTGAAVAFVTSETVAGALAGGAIAAHGIDDVQAGSRQAWTGKPAATLTEQAASEAAKRAGATPGVAALIAAGTDIVASGPVGLEKAGVKGVEEALKIGERVTESEKLVATGEKLAIKGEKAEIIQGHTPAPPKAPAQEGELSAGAPLSQPMDGGTRPRTAQQAEPPERPQERQGPFTSRTVEATQRSEAAKGAARVEELDPAQVRFSQTSAGGRGRAEALRRSLAEKGWAGEPVDAVRTPDGVTTIDNTRVAVARELGMDKIPVRVHDPNEPLPSDVLKTERFGVAKTWGEALAHRTAHQRPALPPSGTLDPPRMPGLPNK